MDAISALEMLGLSENEARVYLSLLSLKEATATEIAKELDLQRRTVYDTSELLLKKGLISVFEIRGVRHFTARGPKVLESFLRKKQKALKSVMPDLKESFVSPRSPEPKLSIITDLDDFQQRVFDILRPKGEFSMFGRGGRTLEFLRRSQVQYVPRLKQTKWRMIQSETDKVKDYMKYFDKSQVKFVPKKYVGKGAFSVSKKSVFLFFPVTDKHIVLEIEHPGMAKTFKNYFDLVWDLL